MDSLGLQIYERNESSFLLNSRLGPMTVITIIEHSNQNQQPLFLSLRARALLVHKIKRRTLPCSIWIHFSEYLPATLSYIPSRNLIILLDSVLSPCEEAAKTSI